MPDECPFCIDQSYSCTQSITKSKLNTYSVWSNYLCSKEVCHLLYFFPAGYYFILISFVNAQS